jgi:hypothetical protein
MTIPSPQQQATPAAPPSPSAPEIPLDPVPVRYRCHGWTAEKQRGFIRFLAECGVARTAAAPVGMSENAAHSLARRPDAENFRNAWPSNRSLRLAANRPSPGISS